MSRINGVGAVNVFGTQYAMRIWLDADKLNSYQLTPVDVSNAILSQNVQVAGGQLGGTPASATQQLTATITEATLLRTPEQFGNILLKVNPNGSQVRLRDVARIERGAETYFIDSRYTGQAASGIGVQLEPGANALATANAVRAKIDELKPFFPKGLEVVYPYDTTPFIKISITEVVKTLFEGIVLVFLVMYLFLQNLRATLIPTIAVPVVLLGAFGIMNAAGFTINVLTMFGLVLAIGLLVDDAIVVVENVERVMAEEHLSALEATRKAMDQITGALIGVAVVLSAVFIPVAFSGGSVGAIYRQFSLTIVSAMLLSVFVALSLTPGALCADPEAGRAEPCGKARLLRRVQSRLRADARPVPGRCQSRDQPLRALARDLRGGDRSGRRCCSCASRARSCPSRTRASPTCMVQAPPGTTQAVTEQSLEDVAQYLAEAGRRGGRR